MREWSIRCVSLALGIVFLPACGFSGQGTLTPTIAPQVPSNVVAVGSPGRATVSWSNSPAASTYSVQRSAVSGGPYAPVPGGTGITGLKFVDTGLRNGIPYYYVVTAVNSFGVSGLSKEVFVNPGVSAVQISASQQFSLVVMQDHTVWGFGVNTGSVLSIPQSTLASSTEVIPLNTPSDILSVSSGQAHALAVKSDGTVWAWGINGSGALGDGTTNPSAIPLQVPNLTGVVAVSAGVNVSLALKSDGTVWAWGANDRGQLGIGSSPGSLSPVQIPGLSSILGVSIRAAHAVAVREDGSVWTWGSNANGEAGIGAVSPPVTSPVQVLNLGGIISVSAGSTHDLAVGSDGSVWTWGAATASTLGFSTTAANSPLRVQVPGLPTIVSVAGGEGFSLAVGADGSVWGWGADAFGQLGNGSTVPAGLAPFRLSNLTGIVAVSGGYDHGLALGSDGKIWGWGQNSAGQLAGGVGTTRAVPEPITTLNQVVSLQTSAVYTMALVANGTVWSWGLNSFGQLGNGTTTPSTIPGQVSGLTGVTRIATGQNHGMAVKSDGTVWAWGLNLNGGLGNNSTTPSSVPVQVSTPSGMTAVGAGVDFSLGLRNDGTVWAWGYNGEGNAGQGTTSAAVKIPVQVKTSAAGSPPLTGITAISVGAAHILALKSDGTVWAWGDDQAGELGDGVIQNFSALAVQVGNLSGVTAISAGEAFSLAIKNDGTVWGWGSNFSGALGFASPAVTSVPLQIPGLTGVTAIAGASGSHYSLFLKSDGTVLSCGQNESGQLGNGSTLPTSNPTPVLNLSSVVAISAGVSDSFAVLADQTVMGWGSNSGGQLTLPSFNQYLPNVITH